MRKTINGALIIAFLFSLISCSTTANNKKEKITKKSFKPSRHFMREHR